MWATRNVLMMTVAVLLAMGVQTQAIGTDYPIYYEADLSLDKVVDKPQALENELVTFTLTLTNNGPDGMDASVDDLLPADLSFDSALPSQGSYDSGNGVWTVGWLSSGAVVSMDLLATVDPGTFGKTLINSATANVIDLDPNDLHYYSDPDLANNSCSEDVEIVPEPATMAVLGLGLLAALLGRNRQF